MTFRHFHQPSSEGSLFFRGIHDPTKELNTYKRELTDLISYILKEEKLCDKYLQQYCPVFLKELEKSRTISWQNRNHPQVKKAEEKIKATVKTIDNYASRKSKPVAKDYQANIRNPIENLKKHGLGRPWGTEIRQRIAHTINLSNEIDSLFSLGLNSVAHSNHVNLGESFIAKIKEDPENRRTIYEIEKEIHNEIRRRRLYVPIIKPMHCDFSLKKIVPVQLGGGRSKDSMLKQFGYVCLNPIGSFSKYKDTWKAGMNSLTWALRSSNVDFVFSFPSKKKEPFWRSRKTSPKC